MGLATDSGDAMNTLWGLAAWWTFSAMAWAADAPTPSSTPRTEVVLVVGAPGSPEYADLFQQWAERWQAAARQAGANVTVIGLDPPTETSDRQALADCLARLPSPASEPLWLILLGHGTFDGKTARYNLRGPDITPSELASWLQPLDRPVAVLNCTSSSAPFLPALSGPRRVVITATRSGFEYNFARLGGFLAAAVQDLSADLDKDEQVSLLEAFLKASASLREFYAQDGRLMTEHALLDDNGDGLGTPADWFQGLVAVKAAKDGAALDGAAARQWTLLKSPQEEHLGPELRARRDALEQQLAALKTEKAKLSEEEYLARIEPVLVALAELYEQAEKDTDRPAGENHRPAGDHRNGR
jgi:hypothetical protein